MDIAWQKLAEQGALVLCFGIAIFVLWRANRKLHLYYEGDPGDPAKNRPPVPGKMAEERTASTAREDAIRKDYDKKLAAEKAEQKAIMKELLDTLRSLE